MIIARARGLAWVFVVLLATTSAGMSRETDETAAPKLSVPRMPLSSGATTYKFHCAVCHGADAKGAGPAASELKVQPPDLTTLAKRHDGKFPGGYVTTILRNGTPAASHGTSDMPVWGPIFSAMSKHDEAAVNIRISNLVSYLESLQQK